MRGKRGDKRRHPAASDSAWPELAQPAVGVVVGVDASRTVLGAVTWAAGEAARLRLPLHLVHVLPPVEEGIGYRTSVPHGPARALLQRAGRVATAVAPRVPVTMLTVNARVGAGLVCYSAPARLLVVGSHPWDGSILRSSGRVLGEVTAFARCPTVVVPSAWAAPGRSHPSISPILVGVDGSAAGGRALAYGAQTADSTDVPLVPISAAGLTNSGPTPAGVEDHESAGYGLIAERLATYRRLHPALTIETLIEVGNPVKSLLDLGRRAQLIVVGSRGHVGVAGPHLGPVSQMMLRTGQCPVAVISPRTRYLAEPPVDSRRGVSTRSRAAQDITPVGTGMQIA